MGRGEMTTELFCLSGQRVPVALTSHENCRYLIACSALMSSFFLHFRLTDMFQIIEKL